MKEIYGNTTSINLKKPDLTQDDPKKGDYVKGKDEFVKQFGGGDAPSDDRIRELINESLGVIENGTY